jgi:hypothetical protein
LFVGVAQPIAGDFGFVVVVVGHGLNLKKWASKKSRKMRLLKRLETLGKKIRSEDAAHSTS